MQNGRHVTGLVKTAVKLSLQEGIMSANIRNMKLKSRMSLSYVMIIGICLIASIAALFMLNKIGDNLSSFYTNNYTVTVNVWRA